MRRLPPLNALKAFESVARLGGIRAAQKELHVTQSAISHQITKLEDFLSNSLFHRKGNKMYLTDVGRDYLTKIEPALNMVGQATADASTVKHVETLTISVPPSILFNWLLPRLSDFLESHNDINVRILEQLTLKPADDTIDCAIEYRYQPNQDFTSTLFFSDSVVAMCTKEYAKKHKIKSIDDIEACTLIETNRRLVSWQGVLTAMDKPYQQKIISLDYTLHALQAAKNGLGIAMANLYNGKSMIDSGELVIPFAMDEKVLPVAPRYYVTTLKSREHLPKVKSFTDWLHKEIELSEK